MKTKAAVLELVRELIQQGESVRGRAQHGSFGDTLPKGIFTEWKAGCATLHHMLGPNPWSAHLELDASTTIVKVEDGDQLLGVLRAIERAVDKGHLARIVDFVRSDALGNLIEQAEQLQGNGFHLACGVMCRAALEQHLRALCERAGCSPPKAKPTVSDYLTALCTAKVLDPIARKHVEAMTAVGNACAHAQPFRDEDVDRVLKDVQRFMAQHPLAGP